MDGHSHLVPTILGSCHLRKARFTSGAHHAAALVLMLGPADDHDPSESVPFEKLLQDRMFHNSDIDSPKEGSSTGARATLGSRCAPGCHIERGCTPERRVPTVCLINN